jgi:hypothetical protein
MTHTKDEALKLALEALNSVGSFNPEIWGETDRAITAIKQALAAPEERYTYGTPLLDAFTKPAPVQDMPKIGCVNHDCDKCKAAAQPDIVKRAEEAFEAAAQRQWVGLTRWEIDAKLKEKT